MRQSSAAAEKGNKDKDREHPGGSHRALRWAPQEVGGALKGRTAMAVAAGAAHTVVVASSSSQEEGVVASGG